MALRQLDPAATVQNLDVLGFTNAAFRRLYGRAYLDLVNGRPCAGLLLRPAGSGSLAQHKGDRLRLLVEKLNLRRLSEVSPHAVVGRDRQHALPAGRDDRRPQAAGRPHHAALDRDHGFRDPSAVGQPAVRPLFHGHGGRGGVLAALGRPAGDMAVTGIPVHPAFSRAERPDGVPPAARAGGRPADRAATGRRVRRRAGRAALPRHAATSRRRWSWWWWPAGTRN